MKKKLFLLTIVASMSFSVTACAKETTPVETVAETSVASESVTEESATIPAETETEIATTIDETETATETTIEAVTEAYEGTDAAVDGEVTYEDGFTVQAGDYIVTDEELAALPDDEWAQIERTYKFLCRMDPSLPTDACDKTIGTVYMRYDNQQLLDLLNQDFSKAYDIIEKCGLDVTTDEGKVLKASEMRENAGTITDFDSFHDAYQDIIEYTGCLARASVEANENLDVALENEDAANGSKYLELVKLYQPSVDELWEFVQFYQMAYDD